MSYSTWAKVLRIFALYAFFLSARSLAAKPCVEVAAELLTGQALQLHPTDRLIGYLGELFENRAINESELARFLEALERERLSNPIHDEDAETDSKRMIHREGIENIIRLGDFDLARLKDWTRELLKSRGVVNRKRDDTRWQTQTIYQIIEFISLQQGTFQMGEAGRQVDITLTHPFEVMSTPVTQKQWVDLMGENPSHFVDGENSITVTVNGKLVKMKPDHPVEKLTWWSTLVFANKLSEKHGLTPTYDLSQIKFKAGTRAEDGSLEGESGVLRINAPNGNIYEAQGYRLPTEAEQEYLLRAGGKANEAFYFCDNVSDLKKYAWYKDNANETTHPVAQLRPVRINGKEIFDLLGNVEEWGHDWYEFQMTNGTNPAGPEMGKRRVLRGGAYNFDSRYLRAGYRDNASPYDRGAINGFRLVRTHL